MAESLPNSASTIEPSLTSTLLGFRGRIDRRTYWRYGIVGMGLMTVVGLVLLDIAGLNTDLGHGLWALLMLWPSLALSIKRWHDRDKSGWWVLIHLIPYAGTLWAFVENALLPGTPGANRFGRPPSHARPRRL